MMIPPILLSMLLVKTFIGISSIHGIGLFAAEFIPKGTIIWKFMENFDQIIPTESLIKLSSPSKEQFLNYAYLTTQGDKYILCFDDARFFNHSDKPNTIDDKEEKGFVIALRDIKIGEELTSNYRVFDMDYQRKLNIRH